MCWEKGGERQQFFLPCRHTKDRASPTPPSWRQHNRRLYWLLVTHAKLKNSWEIWRFIISTTCPHLKPPHVARVAGVFQTVLVALQEKLEKEPGKKRNTQRCSPIWRADKTRLRRFSFLQPSLFSLIPLATTVMSIFSALLISGLLTSTLILNFGGAWRLRCPNDKFKARESNTCYCEDKYGISVHNTW